ncbi:MAG: bis(5'-nucleosyl)-tetraphosphatase (symmetrical) YqeK [Firmicutes bacterium]|nr:bis(5'-nucleosyl)-tetraphosphatase (symmetrical) YqeK [Bacillota bacterium]
MIEESFAKQLAYSELEEHKIRWNHTEHVVALAKRLAIHYGMDSRKAAVAGYLHDATKYWSIKKMKSVISAYYSNDFISSWPEPTLHAVSGAAFARSNGVEEEDVLLAILFHPTGRKQMSLLEKILFVADYAEESRAFENKDIAKTAFVDLDKAVYDILQGKMSHLSRHSEKISSNSLEALAYYQNLMNGGME